MSDTTAKINSKGCEGTGLTEDHATELYHQVGKHFMAIVELQVIDKHGPNLKDKRGVSLGLTQVWPALDNEDLDNHLRELTRVLHQNGAVIGADGTRQAILLEEARGEEPTVEGVIAANPGLKFHPYVSSQLSIDDSPVCDVCGKTEADRIHHAPATNPFAVDDDTEGEAPEDIDDVPDLEEDTAEYDEPEHAFTDDGNGGCTSCGMSALAPVHDVDTAADDETWCTDECPEDCMADHRGEE